MARTTRKLKGPSIGMDVGDQRTFFHVLEREGGLFGEGTIRAKPGAVRRFSEGHGPSPVAIEVWAHSPWTQETAEELGHKSGVAHPRRIGLAEGPS